VEKEKLRKELKDFQIKHSALEQQFAALKNQNEQYHSTIEALNKTLHGLSNKKRGSNVKD
jgi:septal ring factor EnvC (AmiA/AmiB activator)